MQTDTEIRQHHIDEIFLKHGTDIYNAMETVGVITESQFGFDSMMLKNEQDYIAIKLQEIGLIPITEVIEDNEEEYETTHLLITVGFHNGSKTNNNHFYFFYRYGFDNFYKTSDAEKVAIDLYNQNNPF